MTGRDDSRAATPSDDRDAPFEEATPLEAACKLLFGEDEAPRIMRALSTATDLEARREAAETPPGERARDRYDDAGPPGYGDDENMMMIARVASTTSWDWGEGACSPTESGDRFKRVQSLCD